MDLDTQNLIIELCRDRYHLRELRVTLQTKLRDLRKQLYNTSKEINNLDNEIDRHLQTGGK